MVDGDDTTNVRVPTPITEDTTEVQTQPEITIKPVASSSSPPAIEETLVSPPKDEQVTEEPVASQETKVAAEEPKPEVKKDEDKKEQSATLSALPVVGLGTVTPTTERGKSKTTGKTISGWL